VAEGYRGKRVRCARCQEPFLVADPADADDDVVTATLVQPGIPRGARLGRDDFLPESEETLPSLRRPAGPSGRTLLIAGGAGLVLLVALFVGLIVSLSGDTPGLPSTFGGPDAVPEAAAPTALPAGVLRDVKGATVFVKVEAGAASGSGSGFIIKTEGMTGYVVTNHHVVTPPPEEDPATGWGPFRGRRPPFFRPRPGRPRCSLP
jgi:hypothetical protein